MEQRAEIPVTKGSSPESVPIRDRILERLFFLERRQICSFTNDSTTTKGFSFQRFSGQKLFTPTHRCIELVASLNAIKIAADIYENQTQKVIAFVGIWYVWYVSILTATTNSYSLTNSCDQTHNTRTGGILRVAGNC